VTKVNPTCGCTVAGRLDKDPVETWQDRDYSVIRECESRVEWFDGERRSL